MRPIHRLQNELMAITCVLASAGFADRASAQFVNGNNGYGQGYYSSQNYSYGLNLPQVPVPTGQDEIRAADGTACRSNSASNNAYLDMGAIGSQGYGGEYDQGTFYGRLIVPLGDIPKRLDCTALYNLEIQRLQNELALIRAGAGNIDVGLSNNSAPMKVAGPPVIAGPPGAAKAATAATPGRRDKAWAETGWSNTGWQGAAKVGVAPSLALQPTPVQAAPISPMASQSVGPQSDASGAEPPTATSSLVITGSIATEQAPAIDQVEILPWSTEPAIGPRAVVLGRAPESVVVAVSDTSGDESVSNLMMQAFGGGH